ncbi:vWA domain-containing protein [Streptosporangium roseum]|uniref:vWA domain-containing protein n=1 Tax=Streptosporangium roseum TaxID=2001 RepID=UPI003325CD88
MRRRKAKVDPWRQAVNRGWETVTGHPLFRSHRRSLHVARDGDLPPGTWATVSATGWVRHHPAHRAEAEEWAWVFAHLLLHLGFGHADPRSAMPGDIGEKNERVDDHWTSGALPEPAYHAACCLAVDRFLRTLKIGRCPAPLPEHLPAEDEVTLSERWRRLGLPAEYRPVGPPDFLIGDERTARYEDFQRHFAVGVADSATAALGLAGRPRSSADRHVEGPWDLALRWFVSSYPLLGALAAGMKIVADAELARDWQISVAAVSSEAAEIYVNPLVGMASGEWRFVLAHEMLHAALRHGDRVGGRDPYLWNVAADYVINGWLVEMAVGEMPEGLLFDPSLAGLSAEAVYDRIAADLRRVRKLATLRGRGLGDVLDRPLPHPGAPGRYVDLDDYYRNALCTGLAYHQNSGRGHLPSGLEQEIRALDQPPLPWDAALARWFEEHVPVVERRRSYARASRRQASSPDIPRPGWVRPEEVVRQATFGVVLDTSGSMNAKLLGKALGAIASYAVSRDVPRARVVFCDAAAYDAGYLPVEEIAGRVRVRGRGGTVLQPGVNLLERAEDFPPDGPILLITDGYCDVLRIRREHAFLIPEGARLPFAPRGPVFRLTSSP